MGRFDTGGNGNMMRSANPALGEKTFREVVGAFGEDTMTLQGTVNKTGISVLIVGICATVTWNMEQPALLMLLGMFGGLGVALLTVFKKTLAPYTTPIYAALEGLFLGALSRTYEVKFHGIVIMAVGLTLGVLAALLALYTSRLIKVTENFRLGVAAATGGIAIFYLVSMGLSFFGIRIPYIHESGIIGIGFSLFVVTIASLNLVMDFDFIERGSSQGAPKYMEWYAAFGLLVTLVWLYIEILRLLSKIMGRSRN
jgi:uncharacterized YccA/Bax inhibitor family protein